MPTLFSHPAVPLALGLGLGRQPIPRRLLWAGVCASILPDLDVLAFRFGIPYASELGHRGFSHSLLFAFLVALLGLALARCFNAQRLWTFGFLLVSTASHGVLDAFTNGGMGIAFFWPWSTARHFAPVQVIEVSPLSVSRFFSSRGLMVLYSELLWVWLPCILLGLILAHRRRFRGKN